MILCLVDRRARCTCSIVIYFVLSSPSVHGMCYLPQITSLPVRMSSHFHVTCMCINLHAEMTFSVIYDTQNTATELIPATCNYVSAACGATSPCFQGSTAVSVEWWMVLSKLWGWWCHSSGQSAFLSQAILCFFTQSVNKSWQGDDHWQSSVHCLCEWGTGRGPYNHMC